ncbi:MAG: ATP-binding cassette domain-containing protein [Acidobacteria bacterium]|nr:ATP-binding cassette domain-containing protein [Acidobacteriota bacterium]
MIEAKKLKKVFKSRGKSVEALKGISFTAKDGEIFGLLGPNGAGKTTTLRILSTMLSPTGGTAIVEEHDILKEKAEIRRKIGFLSTETGLYDRLTPDDTLKFFGKLAGMEMTDIAKRADYLFDRLDLKKDRKRLISGFSTGMKQKVSIARALIHDPSVIIFDEPTNGLDVLTAKTVTDFLKEMRDEGKTVIISTHILSVVEKICDRFVIIDTGSIVAEGTLPELLEKYEAVELEDIFFKLVPERRDA